MSNLRKLLCSKRFVGKPSSGKHKQTLSIGDVILFALWLATSIAFESGQSDQIHYAYVGPGAGIAVLGSFLAILTAMISAIGVLLTWPIRWCWRSLRSRRAMSRAKVSQVVILGLDGLDPDLTDRFLEEGILPNLAKLRDAGSYSRLGTTWPPLSPVAWSSFSTGTNPGKHNIFDFITRNPSDYRPVISSVRIHQGKRKLQLGRFALPLSRPSVQALKKSKPFWQVLSQEGIFSAILRVPITFPPDKFHGVQLSAMCVPDLRGSQGTFYYFAESETQSDQDQENVSDLVSETPAVERSSTNVVRSFLPGPANPFRDNAQTRIAFEVSPGKGETALLAIDGQKIVLEPNRFTEWVRVSYRLAPGIKVRGICRFYLKQFDRPFALYCTPVQIDPDKPVMPISHPYEYAVYLAKAGGAYATLGLAEDTGSLSEEVIGEEAFLTMAYDIHEERQEMFFDALKRVRRGVVTCVFDAPDRIQHMFWRFLEENHPAAREHPEQVKQYRETIRDMYRKMDDLVGKTLAAADPRAAVFVMSDHGFKSFRRGVDLNAWLLAAGYLHLKNDARHSDGLYLADVDWSRTKAYAIGLAGIYINQRGREGEGIVPANGERSRLVDELCRKLTGLRDPSNEQTAIHEAVAGERVYQGPYVSASPDVIIGYNVGYRVSWDAANGKCGPDVFSDNTKAWSGDHCIHPRLVPGVLFSNQKLESPEANIVDLAPTTLELLGVDTPSYMDGKSLLNTESAS